MAVLYETQNCIDENRLYHTGEELKCIILCDKPFDYYNPSKMHSNFREAKMS